MPTWSRNQDEPIEQWLTHLPGLGRDEEWLAISHKLAEALAAGKSVEEFAASLGLKSGVTGYAYHSVPVALYAWLLHRDDFRKALEAALNCGGDTDSVGAIVGALLGAKLGKQGIPSDLITGIWECPSGIVS